MLTTFTLRPRRPGSLALRPVCSLLLCALGLLYCQATQAQTLRADYQLQNTRASAVGSSTLADAGGANSFQTDTVDATSRIVLRFGFNQGVALAPTTGVIPSNSYTIVMLFRLDSVSGFVRLVDFKNRTSDNGLYIQNGRLEDCTTCTNIPANTYVQVVYTRSSAGTFTAYVNGALQGQGPDTNGDLVIDGNNRLGFFQDDAVASNEASAGNVARIRLYDAPMTQAQVSALDRLPASCSYLLTPTSQFFAAPTSNTTTVNVTTASGCSWAAVSNDSWITINTGATGTGNGTVNYSVAANTTGVPRAGSMTIAGITFPVTQAAGVTLSGRVVDGAANGIGGATVALSGSASANTTTDSSGNYSFPNVATGGNYTVTATSSSYSFNPANQTINNLTASRFVNFIGTRTTVQISGRITDALNNGLGSVTVALSGTQTATTTTDAAGNYTFGNLPAGGNYLVVPININFSPATQQFNNLRTNGTASFTTAPSIPPQCNATSFSTAINFAVGTTPFSVAVGDFNGDGKLDLATANQSSNDVSILLGNGTGSFGAATSFAAGQAAVAVVVGDFNADGNLDLAVANPASNNVSILLGTGTGSFGAATNFAVGTSPLSVAVGDFNGDGKTDLAVANSGTNNVSILLGTGTGSFGAATNFAAGTTAYSIATGDFNGDSKGDLAVANQSSDNVSILLGTGTGSFGAATNFAVGTTPRSVAVGDLNSDGKLDVVTANRSSNNVSILLGNGTGSFGVATNFAVGTIPVSVALADLNGDGKTDLAVANAGTNNVSILLGTGTGSFGAATNFAAGTAAVAVAIGDFNADNKLDTAAANQLSNNVSILLNNGTTCNMSTAAAITGSIKDANNNPLAGVTVTLSGTLTRTLPTDASGNYAFANLMPGGNYSVTPQSPLYVFVPSRTDFNTLSGTPTANFKAAPVAVPAPTPPLTDDFTGALRDTQKWNLGTLTQPAGTFDPQISVVQQSGRLVITPRANATGRHYNGYVSVNSFDFTSAQASVEVPQVASGGAETVFALGADNNNNYRFVVGMSNSPSFAGFAPQALAEIGVFEVAPVLVFQVKIGGVVTQQVIPYDPVAHRFWRFRNDALQSAIVFETSADNTTYIERFRRALDKSAVSALAVELSAGTVVPTGDGGTAQFDNLSLVPSTAQFTAANLTVGESAGRATITITRVGNVNTGAATLTYATTDNPAAVRCDDTQALPGTSFARCDYATTVDTVSFAAGEVSKSFTVPIIDDSFAEGDETFQLRLLSASGASLGAPALITVTITDNDAVGAANPVFTTPFFVRQHYLDFLAREPEQGEPWSNILNNCPNVNNVDPNNVSAGCDRILVSGAFFGSPEFLSKGVYTIVFYRVAFNRLPEYTEFAPDLRSVTGATPNETNAKRAAFAVAFTQRAEFTTAYGGLSNTAYVAALMGRYSLTQITTPDPAAPDGTQKVTLTQTELLNRLNAGTLSRAQVLRAIVQSDEVSLNREAINAFVAAQYYGFLRRTPDTGGFNGWVNYLGMHPGDFRTMVNGFMNSIEYRLRFGVSN